MSRWPSLVDVEFVLANAGFLPRWLAFLDKVLADAAEPGRLRAADLSVLDHGGIPRGEISVELLLDPRITFASRSTTTRLWTGRWPPNPSPGRPITRVTYDTSQSFKVRAAGLRVRRLSMPIEN